MQLLLLFKPAAQAQVGKTKLFINCLRNPTNTCATEKLKKQTHGSNQRLTALLTPYNVPVSNTVPGRSTHESGLAGNTLQIWTF